MKMTNIEKNDQLENVEKIKNQINDLEKEIKNKFENNESNDIAELTANTLNEIKKLEGQINSDKEVNSIDDLKFKERKQVDEWVWKSLNNLKTQISIVKKSSLNDYSANQLISFANEWRTKSAENISKKMIPEVISDWWILWGIVGWINERDR